MATMKMIEPWLYELRHITKTGEVSLRYYGKFTSWDRRPLTKPLGDDLNKARAKLGKLRELNALKRDDVKVELDEERKLRESLELQKQQKEQARKGTTSAEWAQKYFDELVPPEKRATTVRQEKSRIKTLISFFGDLPLCSINVDLSRQYRKARAAEVGLSTVNPGVSFLRYLLNMAAELEVLDAVPRIKLSCEKDRPQQRSVDEDEYLKILAGMGREQQRVVIG